MRGNDQLVTPRIRVARAAMMRRAGWVALAALMLAGYLLDRAGLRAAAAPVLLLLLGYAVPAALRHVLWALAVCSLVLIVLGYSDRVLDLMPALIAATVAWLFARTLRRGREPLIARAIAAIDGREPLADPAVGRYARRLTRVWAIYQALLAAVGLLIAGARAVGAQHWPYLPSPRLFGLVVLPLAVAALAVAEFALRPRLLPQAPRQPLSAFVRALVRAWPSILNE